jgi:hypothetical protein
MTIDVRPDLSKAKLPIVCTDESASNVTDVRSVVSRKAPRPINVTDLGMTIDVRPDLSKANSPIVCTDEPASNVSDVRPVASWKAVWPMDITVDGMVAVPTQRLPLETTLLVIVNDPPSEQLVLAHAGEAGATTKKEATTATAQPRSNVRDMHDTSIPDAQLVYALKCYGTRTAEITQT